MNILITESESYSEIARKIYADIGMVYFLDKQNNRLELEKINKNINVIVIRLAHNINKEWIDKMPNLKVIATPTTGLNHIDVEYAKSKGIKVVSLRGHASFLKNITSTAELSLGLMLALVRKIFPAFEDVKRGKWDRMSFRGNQLTGKTLGIVGYGRLGKIMARYAKAFNMKVLACDPNVSEKFMKSRGVEKVNMEDLFKKSDMVSLHVLLTEDTQNLVKEKHLKMMKKTAYLINTARAELIEKDALYNSLKNKWIAGAGIDVMWNEDGNGLHLKNDPLWDYAKKNSNLIIVPHIGGATFEAMHITEDFIAKEVQKYVRSGKLE